MLGPVIRGRGVRLEPPRREHATTRCEWLADREVSRYLSSRHPITPSQDLAQLARWEQAADEVVWSLVRESDDKLLGTCGLHAIAWRNRNAEIAFMIGERDEWRKGYATEAVALATTYAFRDLGLHKTSANVIDGNLAARRALEKNAYRQCIVFERARYVDGQWRALWIGELLEDEWSPRAQP